MTIFGFTGSKDSIPSWFLRQMCSYFRLHVCLLQLLLRSRDTSAARIRTRASVPSSTVSRWDILTPPGPGASTTTAFTGYAILKSADAPSGGSRAITRGPIHQISLKTLYLCTYCRHSQKGVNGVTNRTECLKSGSLRLLRLPPTVQTRAHQANC